MKRILIFCAAIFFVAIKISDAQVATGGAYTLEQSVIAAGGGSSTTGAEFTIVGTIGQAAGGNGGQAAPFALYGGFWTPQLAPTAALASIGGRVRMTNGKGIMNVLISLTDASGETRCTRSGISGRYRFDDVPTGQTYILTATAKRFVFSSPTQIVNVAEDLNEIDFVADE